MSSQNPRLYNVCLNVRKKESIKKYKNSISTISREHAFIYRCIHFLYILYNIYIYMSCVHFFLYRKYENRSKHNFVTHFISLCRYILLLYEKYEF